MTRTEQKEILDDIRNFSGYWYKKYNRKVEYEEIESAAFYWARNKLDKLNDIKKADLKNYRAYLKTCLSKELTKVVREEIVRSAYYMPTGLFTYTLQDVKEEIKKGNPELLNQLDEYCTPKQKQCIMIISSGENIDEAAKRLGITRGAVDKRAREGLQTLVLKNKNNFDA